MLEEADWIAERRQRDKEWREDILSRFSDVNGNINTLREEIRAHGVLYVTEKRFDELEKRVATNEATRNRLIGAMVVLQVVGYGFIALVNWIVANWK